MDGTFRASSLSAVVVENKAEASLEESENQPRTLMLWRVADKLRRFSTSWFHKANDEEETSVLRQKRSVMDAPEEAEAFVNNDLSQNLLTESLNRHRIRNVADKVAHLDPANDQIVAEILQQFCNKPTLEIPDDYQPIEDNELSDDDGNLTDVVKNKFELRFASQPEDNEGLLSQHALFVCEDYGKVFFIAT